ncbi:ABC transporter ATP-binding protein [Nakamurella leprariae]|uniref:ABC transporter ATP-binding protein n=1 Tax=Nakamurella leprariae TaxID=2803911 RepID=UPI0038B3422B
MDAGPADQRRDTRPPAAGSAQTTAPGATATRPLLEVDQLRVHFATPAGLVRAVDGVSLSVRAGEVLGVVGESGSGKTVMSRRAMGLVGPGTTTRLSGTVRYDGTEISALPPAELSKLWGSEMAMILQDPMTSLNPVKRVGEQIGESLRRHLGLDRAAAHQRAVQLLRSVGLSEPERRVRQYPHELSGGMRQRVTIAIALSCDPRLLFADEPTTALDVTVQAQILELLARQQAEHRMAMMIVTHDLRVVRGHTDRVVVMYAGKVVEAAPTRTLFAAPRMPYTEALMNAVPPLTGSNHAVLRVIPGRPPNLLAPPPGCAFAPRCASAQERCLTEMPPLRSAADLAGASPGGSAAGAPAGGPAPAIAGTPDDHVYRCWYPVGTEAGDEARRTNIERGHTAAGTPILAEAV